MAFLDNSGDIILDAVLTDTGRMRLAKGDGSFRVAKFALGDDEINYSLYNKNNVSGTAYFDLEILQTPVLEAFSNNVSSMKSKLITVSRNNLLYLPVVKLDTINDAKTNLATSLVNNGFVLAADYDTESWFDLGAAYGTTAGVLKTQGALYGSGQLAGGQYIKVDQGLDTTEIPYTQALDADLREEQYLVEIDNRFASIIAEEDRLKRDSSVLVSPSYIDDDNIASYFFSLSTDAKFVKNDTGAVTQIIAGPRGTNLRFALRTSAELVNSDYLFNLLGKDITAGFVTNPGTATNVRGILTNVRVIGVTTGNIVDIPLMIVKKIAP